MTKANSRQVGGTHYKTEYEHWDLAVATGMGHLEGSATKYIARWRKKDGRKDLDKARHYLQKLVEVASSPAAPSHPRMVRPLGNPFARSEVRRFASANGLTDAEQELIYRIAVWRYPEDLIGVPDLLTKLIEENRVTGTEPVLRDPDPVPLTEENKHAERGTTSGEGKEGGNSG